MRKLIALISTKDKTPEEMHAEMLDALEQFRRDEQKAEDERKGEARVKILHQLRLEEEQHPMQAAADQLEEALSWSLTHSGPPPENYQRYRAHVGYLRRLWHRLLPRPCGLEDADDSDR